MRALLCVFVAVAVFYRMCKLVIFMVCDDDFGKTMLGNDFLYKILLDV